jgi:hypothetical protein
MEKFGIFYRNLEYITSIWYILWLFGNLAGIWYIHIPITPFWYIVTRKIWQPWDSKSIFPNILSVRFACSVLCNTLLPPMRIKEPLSVYKNASITLTIRICHASFYHTYICGIS